MTELKKGMLVQHATLGVGKVVALDPKAVHVFFAQSQDRYATKLRLEVAQPFLSASPRADAWLSGLSTFAFDEKAARYRISDPWISDADATERFLEVYPGGFSGAKYLGDGKTVRERNARWRRAQQLFSETLGDGAGERLLEAGDVEGLIERTCRVEGQVRLLLSPAERGVHAAALADADKARAWFEAVFAVIGEEAPGEASFAALASAVALLPQEAARESSWFLTTFLPFVARPDRHALLRPKVTCEAAQRLRVELAYRPEPSWGTYAALLKASGDLLEKLRPLGARDHVDVESFMHVAIGKHSKRKAQPDAV